MSAFICEDKTLNRVVTGLKYVLHTTTAHKLLSDAGYDLATTEGLSKLGQDLHMMNVDAVDQRYEEENIPEIYSFRPEFVNPVQVYVSLRCLLYQCSEGDVDQQPLYRLMQQVSDILAHKIVRDLPAYEKADWA